MFTLAISYQDLIYFCCLVIVAYTSWHIGIRYGAGRTIDHLVEEGLLELDEEPQE